MVLGGRRLSWEDNLILYLQQMRVVAVFNNSFKHEFQSKYTHVISNLLKTTARQVLVQQALAKWVGGELRSEGFSATFDSGRINYINSLRQVVFILMRRTLKTNKKSIFFSIRGTRPRYSFFTSSNETYAITHVWHDPFLFQRSSQKSRERHASAFSTNESAED